MRRLPVPDPGEPDARSATRYLLWLVRNQTSTIIGGMFFGIVWMVSQALMPAVIGRTIDAGVTHRDQGELLRWSAVVLVLGAATATSGILRHRNALSNFLAAAYSTVQVTTRQATRLGATLQQRVAAGDVVAIGTSDIAEIGGGLDVSARLSGAIVAIIAVAVIMLTTSVPLGLIVLVGVPVLTALTGLLLRPLHERQRHFRSRQGELTARAIDIAAGLRVLRGIGGEVAFAERYRRESQDLRGAAVAVTRVESGLAAVEVLMPGIIVAGVTFLAARFAIDGRLTVGELVAFYGYAAFLATPLRTLMEAADNITRAHVAARRVVRILNLRPELSDPQHPVSPQPGSTLADEESGLEIEPGALFAVACSDPADADALASRLSRFEDSGQPTLGGVPLAAMRIAEVRARILLARNADRFFTGTLREELDSRGQATDDEILAAVDAASAREVLDALPEGLDTEVTDGGRTFSGGQLQRLRLVRALLARREFTILVEPTSAVDAHTEARIAEHLAALHSSRVPVHVNGADLHAPTNGHPGNPQLSANLADDASAQPRATQHAREHTARAELSLSDGHSGASSAHESVTTREPAEDRTDADDHVIGMELHEGRGDADEHGAVDGRAADTEPPESNGYSSADRRPSDVELSEGRRSGVDDSAANAKLLDGRDHADEHLSDVELPEGRSGIDESAADVELLESHGNTDRRLSNVELSEGRGSADERLPDVEPSEGGSGVDESVASAELFESHDHGSADRRESGVELSEGRNGAGENVANAELFEGRGDVDDRAADLEPFASHAGHASNASNASRVSHAGRGSHGGADGRMSEPHVLAATSARANGLSVAVLSGAAPSAEPETSATPSSDSADLVVPSARAVPAISAGFKVSAVSATVSSGAESSVVGASSVAAGSASVVPTASAIAPTAPTSVPAASTATPAASSATSTASTTVLFTTSPLLLDRAHRVAYVEAGRIVAVGTHRELLANEPRYATVVTRGEDEG